MHDVHCNTGPLLAGVSEAVNEHDLSVVSVLSASKLRRSDPSRRQAELPRKPPLSSPTRWPERWTSDLASEPLGVGTDEKPSTCPTCGRATPTWPRRARLDHSGDVQRALRERLQRRRALAGGADHETPSPTTGRQVDLREAPAILRRTHDEPGVVSTLGARVIAKLGDSVTTDHISPAGNIRAPRQPGILDRRWRRRGDFNITAPVGEITRYGARHVRQHSHPQPDGARTEGGVS